MQFEAAIRKTFNFHPDGAMIAYGSSYSLSKGKLQLLLILSNANNFIIAVEESLPQFHRSQSLYQFTFRGDSVIRTRFTSVSEYFYNRNTNFIAQLPRDVVDYQYPEMLAIYLEELVQQTERELAALVQKYTLDKRLFFGSELHFSAVLKWLRQTWGPSVDSLKQRYFSQTDHSTLAQRVSLTRHDAVYELKFEFVSQHGAYCFARVQFNKAQIRARYVPRRDSSPSALFAAPQESDYTELSCAMGLPEKLLEFCKQIYNDSVVPQLEQLFCRTPLV